MTAYVPVPAFKLGVPVPAFASSTTVATPATPVPAGPGVTTPGTAVKDDPKPAVEPNCVDCVNFILSRDTPTTYRRGPGAAMCGFKDKPIGNSVLPTKNLGDREAYRTVGAKLAKGCKGFGVAKSGDHKRAFPVAFPMDVATPTTTEMTQCKTCTSCSNFIPPTIVQSEFNWTHGMCAAKGVLVPPQNTTYMARDCESRTFGPTRSSVFGINLFLEYEEDYLSPDLVGDFIAANKYEPTSHASDKPVTDDDKARGIAAWKYIADKARPEHQTGIYLPVYGKDHLTPQQLAKVPQTGDDEHPELYHDHNNAVYKVAVLWTALDETPALWGQAGVGKTELYRHLAWMMQLPFERISITASTELDDLAGKTHYEEGRGTYFEYGRLPAAWQTPVVICLDEPNVGQPDVWQFIRPLTDNSKQLVLDMNQGETVKRHPDCFMGMAMNPAWDPRNVGAATIGDADGSRLMHISMELPPAEIEMQIIRERCKLDGFDIEKRQMRAVMSIADEVRRLSQDGELPITWGIRPQIKVARALKYFDFIAAYRMSAADFLDPEQAQALLDVVRSHRPDGGEAAPKARSKKADDSLSW